MSKKITIDKDYYAALNSCIDVQSKFIERNFGLEGYYRWCADNNQDEFIKDWNSQQKKIDKLKQYIKDHDICICDSNHDYICEKCEVLDE